MKKFVKFNEVVGKTIKEIKQGRYDQDMFVFFTDDTWTIIKGEYHRDDDDYDCIHAYPSFPAYQPTTHHMYVAHGIQSLVEASEAAEAKRKEEESIRRGFRYQQYVNLKKEFDPDPGQGI